MHERDDADYPEMSRDEGARARAAARQLVDGALGGRVPPPVEFAAPPEQDGGDAGE